MAADFTKLLARLVPVDDGEDVLKLRTGVVSSVNADGTVDVTISGLTIPNLPRLRSVSVAVGETVQVVTYRGSLLVIGPVGQTNAMPPRAVKTGSVSGVGPVGSGFFSSVVSFGVTFPALPSVHVNCDTQAGPSAQWSGRGTLISTTGFTLYGTGPSSTFTATWEWTAILGQ